MFNMQRTHSKTSRFRAYAHLTIPALCFCSDGPRCHQVLLATKVFLHQLL